MPRPSGAAVSAWLAAALALAAVLVVFFHRVILFGEVFSPADLLFSYAPWRDAFGFQPPSNPTRSDDVFLIHPVMASHWARLAQGSLPGLDPSQMAGVPAFLDHAMLGLVVYPLSIVYWVFAPDVAPGAFAVLRLWLAGMFMFAYGRQIGLSAMASLLAGLAFMLNGHFVVWLSSTLPSVGLWLPLGLLGAERVLRGPGPRSAVVLAVTVAPMYLGGYLPTAVIATIAIGLYIVAGAWAGRTAAASGSSTDGVAVVGWALAGGLGAVAIGAFGIVPAIAELVGTEVAGRSWSVWSYDTRNLATFVYADYWGSPVDGTWWQAATNYCESVTYLGLVPVLLAPVALLADRGWRPWLLAGLAIFTLAYVYGVPGVNVVGHLPVLRMINNYRWVVVVALAVSVLAGMGLDALRQRRIARGRALAAMAGTAVALLATYAIAAWTGWEDAPAGHRGSLVWGGARATAICMLTVGVVATLMRPGPGRGSWMSRGPVGSAALAALVVAIAAVDLVEAGIRFNPTIAPSRFYPSTPALDWLHERSDEGRVAVVGEPPVGTLPGATTAVYGLRSITGYDLSSDDRYVRVLGAAQSADVLPHLNAGFVFFDASLDPRSSVLDALSVRYVAVPSGMDLVRYRRFVNVPPTDTVVGEIVDGRIVGQTFECPAPGLSRIDFFPATNARTNTGRLIVRLEEASSSDVIVEQELDLATIADNARLPIEFPPVADSAGTRYRLVLESPGAMPGNAVTAWAASDDRYDGGTLLENGRAVDGDLRFAAYVTPVDERPELRTVVREDMTIIENLDAMPTAWVVHAADVMETDASIEALRDGYPVGERVLLEQAPASTLRAGRPATPVDIERSSPERLMIEADLDAPGVLVVSERFDPRWRATVDGRSAAVMRADVVLSAIELPAGRHVVELTYADPVVGASATISAAGLLVAAVALVVGRRRRPV